MGGVVRGQSWLPGRGKELESYALSLSLLTLGKLINLPLPYFPQL